MPVFDSEEITTIRESRIVRHAGLVKTDIHFRDVGVANIVVTSADTQCVDVAEISQKSVSKQSKTISVNREIFPIEAVQPLVVPISRALCGAASTGGGSPLSTEIILNFLKNSIGEEQFTEKINLIRKQVISDLKYLSNDIDSLETIIDNLSRQLGRQQTYINDLILTVTANANMLDRHAAQLHQLSSLGKSNKKAIEKLEQVLNGVQVLAQENKNELDKQQAQLAKNTKELLALNALTNSHTAEISANHALLDQLRVDTDFNSNALAQLETRVFSNTGRIDLLEIKEKNTGTLVAKNVTDIGNLKSLLGTGGIVSYQQEEGYGKDREIIRLEKEWLSGKPLISTSFSHGSTAVCTITCEQEIICGHSGVKPSGNPGKYEFSIYSGLYQRILPNVKTVNYYPPGLIVHEPQGSVVTSSPTSMTVTDPTASLKIVGTLRIANPGIPNVGGIVTLQLNVNNTGWVDIDSLFMYFSKTDAVGIHKSVNKLFTFPQTNFTYKFRGKLVISDAKYSGLTLQGSVGVASVEEGGIGKKLSDNVFVKWIAKD